MEHYAIWLYCQISISLVPCERKCELSIEANIDNNVALNTNSALTSEFLTLKRDFFNFISKLETELLLDFI